MGVVIMNMLSSVRNYAGYAIKNEGYHKDLDAAKE